MVQDQQKEVIIYGYCHVPSGFIYIGSSIQHDGRKLQHSKQLRLNEHHCRNLQDLWNKVNSQDFNWMILETIYDATKQDRKLAETKWIKSFGELALNSMKVVGWCNFTHSQATKDRMRDTHLDLARNSPSYLENVSKGLKEYYLANPEGRITRGQKTAARFEDPLERLWIGAKASQYYDLHPEARAEASIRNSKSMKDRYTNNPEASKITSDSILKHHEEHPETGQRISIGLLKFYQKHPEMKVELSEKQKIIKARLYEERPEVKDKIAEGVRRYAKEHPEALKRSDASKAKVGASGRRHWADPVKKAATIEKRRLTRLKNKNLKALASSKATVEACIESIENSGTR